MKDVQTKKYYVSNFSAKIDSSIFTEKLPSEVSAQKLLAYLHLQNLF